MILEFFKISTKEKEHVSNDQPALDQPHQPRNPRVNEADGTRNGIP
jgi:hypothetical protein